MNFLKEQSEDNQFLREIASPEESNNILMPSYQQEPIKQENVVVERKEQMVEEKDWGTKQTSKKSEESSRVNQKRKTKQFYNVRIAHLRRGQDYILERYNYGSGIEKTSNSKRTPMTKEERKKNNASSAQKSRARNKDFMYSLIQTNQEQQRTIDELRQKLMQVTRERDWLKQNNNEIQNFYQSKAQAYDQLDKILNESTNEVEIKQKVMEILDRFGTMGGERTSMINAYMSEIVETLVSDMHKYLMSESGFLWKGINVQSYSSLDSQIIRQLGLQGDRLSINLQKNKIRFSQESIVFKNLTQEFYRIFKSIQEQGKVLEMVFKEMMKDIETKKLGRLLLWFEENKFLLRELKQVRTAWTNQMTTGEQNQEMIRKQIKKE